MMYEAVEDYSSDSDVSVLALSFVDKVKVPR